VNSPPDPTARPDTASVDLLWIPLGAGGVGFVRLNGRIYEAMRARRERRAPAPLHHTALVVHSDGSDHIVENAWPSPDGDLASRGVVIEGPVFSHRLSRFRMFRYEVRRWRDGVIADAAEAVGGPQRLTSDPETARRLLDLVPMVPPHVWGRDDLGVGEMWNSNSVVAWLLARSDLAPHRLVPPGGGIAPGWDAGVAGAGLITP